MPIQTVDPASVGFSEARLARLAAWMDQQVESDRLAGLSVLVHRRGGDAYFNCAGQMDREAGKPLAEDTIFRIYSMTKPITAVAAMICYEEGCFQLDDPIARFLPEFTRMRVWDGRPGGFTLPAENRITVRHLMTHTAGFTYAFMNDNPVDAHYREHKIIFSAAEGDDGAANLAALTERLAEAPLTREPGTGWGYSVAIDVLGRLVEVWSGQPLDAFLAERIFAPLGMTDTGFTVPADKLDRFAACYGPATGGGLDRVAVPETTIRKTGGVGLALQDAPAGSRFLSTPPAFSGGGGLVGTIGDYARFCRMLLNKGELEGARILGRKTVEFMALNHLPDNRDMAAMGQPVWSESKAEGIGYGLGMAVVIDPATTELMRSPGEYFWGGAASTAFWIDPVEDMFVVLMTQLMPSSFYPLRQEVRVATYQALVD